MILPVLAVAIFDFRSSALMEAETAAAVDDILADSTRLNVTTLLQSFLFL